jgi:hypothetical protein
VQIPYISLDCATLFVITLDPEFGRQIAFEDHALRNRVGQSAARPSRSAMYIIQRPFEYSLDDSPGEAPVDHLTLRVNLEERRECQSLYSRLQGAQLLR